MISFFNYVYLVDHIDDSEKLRPEELNQQTIEALVAESNLVLMNYDAAHTLAVFEDGIMLESILCLLIPLVVQTKSKHFIFLIIPTRIRCRNVFCYCSISILFHLEYNFNPRKMALARARSRAGRHE